MRIIRNPDEFSQLVGETLGPSDWVTITQERINAFADATNDHQWIHVDPKRAAEESPGGTTIAHGYLTLSLVPSLSWTIYKVEGAERQLNYGSNRLRFMAPVPVNARIRMRETVKEVEAKDKSVKVVTEAVMEMEGNERPVMVAETISLYLR